MTSEVLTGDVLEVLPTLTPGYTACFCDPPYGLEFMGKQWDHGVPGVDVWRLVYDLLAPGGVLLAFGGTRTWHRLAVAIEDAGFEIFDTLMWLHAQGFPKGHAVGYALHKDAEQAAQHDVRFMRTTYLSETVYACRKCGQVLLKGLSEQGLSAPGVEASGQIWRGQSGVEGWSYLLQDARQLYRCPVCTMSHGILADGAQGRLCDGTSLDNGSGGWPLSDAHGSGAPSGPQPVKQRDGEPEAVRLERAAQAFRGWNVALKPAWEPIIAARKPRVGTYAQTAAEYGSGALWIDGGRIGAEQTVTRRNGNSGGNGAYGRDERVFTRMNPPGRWPANLILDEAAGDALGESARYFYCPKSSRSERDAGLEGMVGRGRDTGRSAEQPSMNGGEGNPYNRGVVPIRNHHPTVKPLALCEYLARLILPPESYRDDARLLVPFAGSGSEMIGALRAGWRNVTGVELDAEYSEIARRRIAAAQAQLPLPVETAQ
jgi:hypothetical protein